MSQENGKQVATDGLTAVANEVPKGGGMKDVTKLGSMLVKKSMNWEKTV